jgi:hypothetical protein
VIQHYAPVEGWGGEEQVHNVDYDPVKTVGGGGEQVHNVLSKLAENLLVRHNGRHGEQRKSKREREREEMFTLQESRWH